MDDLAAGGEEIVVMAEMLPAMKEFVDQFGADDFVCTMHPLPPTPPTSHPGLDGLTDAWSDYGEAFETVRVRFQDVRESNAALEAAGLGPRLPREPKNRT